MSQGLISGGTGSRSSVPVEPGERGRAEPRGPGRPRAERGAGAGPEPASHSAPCLAYHLPPSLWVKTREEQCDLNPTEN